MSTVLEEALAISIVTNFVLLISWSWSRSRLRRILRADHVCMSCGLPQTPTLRGGCPRCQGPDERGEWLEI